MNWPVQTVTEAAIRLMDYINRKDILRIRLERSAGLLLAVEGVYDLEWGKTYPIPPSKLLLHDAVDQLLSLV